MPTPLFNPGPEETQELLLALADPELSLQDIAEKHKVSLPALSLALLRPDIAEALEALQSAFASGTRLCAANQLPIAAAALVTILSDHADTCSHTPVQPNLRSFELRRRQHETARRAAWLLHRLANYDPTRPKHPPRTSPERKLGPSGAGFQPAGIPAAAQPSLQRELEDPDANRPLEANSGWHACGSAQPCSPSGTTGQPSSARQCDRPIAAALATLTTLLSETRPSGSVPPAPEALTPPPASPRPPIARQIALSPSPRCSGCAKTRSPPTRTGNPPS